MKRVISLILVLCLCLSLCLMLVGCGKTGKCEICGKEGKLSKVEIAGESSWVCSDCEEGIEALGNLLG